MQVERFFQSTRGKIVAALRARHSASALDLASEFELSPNAIRQQLMVLERDGMVETHPVRRGKTKPTLEYTLTARAEEFFPQQYDRMLNAVLREIRLQGGDEAVERIFAGMAERTRGKVAARLEPHPSAEGKVVALTSLLRERGVEAEYERAADGTFVIREHNCPYAKTVAEHPEVCSVIHGAMKDALPGETRQVESLATGGKECRFEVTSH